MRQIKLTQTITPRDRGVNEYLRQISLLPRVTPDEEVELALRIQAGDEQALNRLVEANLLFVVSVAKQYLGNGLDLDDLIDEGNIGLITAAKRFDPSRGFKFITYAVWWIRQALVLAISEHTRMIRLPQSQIANVYLLQKVRAEFLQNQMREPSIAELAELSALPESKVIDAVCKDVRPLSLDASLDSSEDSGTLAEVTPDMDCPATDDMLDRGSLREDLGIAMRILSPRDADIVRSFFGIGCHAESLNEIGMRLGLTGERVRQIKDKSIRRLSRPAVKEMLLQYVN